MLSRKLLHTVPFVENMRSGNGNYVPNQFVIYTKESSYFQSYSTIIAAKVGGKIYLDANKWDYSITTGKYRNKFLGMNKKETLAAIDAGKIELVDLNV